MTESSYYWGGTVTGDAATAPYSDDEFSDIWRKLFQFDRADEGPIVGVGNELEVVDAGGSTARVQSGAALVDGKYYENDDNIDFTVSGNTQYWVVGLRKDFAAQEVRAFADGPYADGGTALASIVQTDGTTWEILLALVLTDTGGNVDSVFDYRDFAGIRAFVSHRRGADATDWSLPSADGSAVEGEEWRPNTRIQVGSVRWSGSAADSGDVQSPFPIAFSDVPVVFITVNENLDIGNQGIVVWNRGPLATLINFGWRDMNGNTYTELDFMWVAIGPR